MYLLWCRLLRMLLVLMLVLALMLVLQLLLLLFVGQWMLGQAASHRACSRCGVGGAAPSSDPATAGFAIVAAAGAAAGRRACICMPRPGRGGPAVDEL
jgi:hypothetical protein